MDIHTNIPLKNFTTMKLGGNARFMTDVHTPDEAANVYINAKKQNLPVFVLGGGSNIIAKDEGFSGIVIRMRIPGFQIIDQDEISTTIKIGAGEILDEIVQKTVDMNLCGIETLSGVPGTIGAAPVQNVGAYGQEIADTLISLEAYDTKNNQFVILKKDLCKFRYRDSIFRNESIGRFIICSITLKLSKNTPQPPFYDSLQKYFDEFEITNPTVQIIRKSVLEIRKNKLPDPKINPNVGSFFKNCIVEQWKIDQIKKDYPDIPAFLMDDGQFKIPTGWLIEKAGLKGLTFHGIRVYENNALVLVNDSAKSYKDLALARADIIQKVREIFCIEIEQEPLEI